MAKFMYALVFFCLITANLADDNFSAFTSYRNLDTEKSLTSDYIKDVESTWSIPTKYSDATATSTYAGLEEKIVLSTVTLNKANHDFSGVTVSLDKANNLIFKGTDVFKFEFGFNYQYTYTVPGWNGKGSGTATGGSVSYQLTQSWEQKGLIPQVDLIVTFDTSVVVLQGDRAGDSYAINLSRSAIHSVLVNKEFEGVITNIKDQINTYLVNKAKNSSLTIQTNNPPVSIGVDYSSNRAAKNLENGVVYYNRFDVNQGPLKLRDIPTWDSFNENDAPHQYFFHQTFLQTVTKEMTRNSWDFMIYHTNPPTQLVYDLTVSTIGDFYPCNFKLFNY